MSFINSLSNEQLINYYLKKVEEFNELETQINHNDCDIDTKREMRERELNKLRKEKFAAAGEISARGIKHLI